MLTHIYKHNYISVYICTHIKQHVFILILDYNSTPQVLFLCLFVSSFSELETWLPLSTVYLCTCVELLILKNSDLRFIHVVRINSVIFYCLVVFHCMNIPVCYSLAERHLGFQFLITRVKNY